MTGTADKSIDCDIVYRAYIILSNFVTERDKQFLKADMHGVSLFEFECEVWAETEFYQHTLHSRKRLLPRGGICLKVKHLAGCGEIYLCEKLYTDGKVVMLYVMKNFAGVALCGFYQVNDEVFFSPLADGKLGDPIGKEFVARNVENFVLEVYAFLTCGIEVKRKRNKAVRIYENEAAFRADHVLSQVCLIKQEVAHREIASECCLTSGKSSVLVEISPYVRKLSIGWKASEEAMANAERYGIELGVGETFVTGFEKSVWVKE
ncbi:hypothetical protein AGMMS49975_23190 [Clostridia bacterium]|nr:hypothetical protein AGMMS49975_23190 [Clostridia bacterium]